MLRGSVKCAPGCHSATSTLPLSSKCFVCVISSVYNSPESQIYYLICFTVVNLGASEFQ